MTAFIMIGYPSTYARSRPWGIDILAVVLFALTAGMLLVTLGSRSEVQAAAQPALVVKAEQMKQAVLPRPMAAEIVTETTPDPFLPSAKPRYQGRPSAPEVSLESQQKILKIINGDQ